MLRKRRAGMPAPHEELRKLLAELRMYPVVLQKRRAGMPGPHEGL